MYISLDGLCCELLPWWIKNKTQKLTCHIDLYSMNIDVLITDVSVWMGVRARVSAWADSDGYVQLYMCMDSLQRHFDILGIII